MESKIHFLGTGGAGRLLSRAEASRGAAVSRSNLLITGHVWYDRISLSGQPPRERMPGGSGYFAALGASFFARPSLLATVGRDLEQAHLDGLSERGVDMSLVRRNSLPSVVWRGEYLSPTQYRTIEFENYTTDPGIGEIPEAAKGFDFAYLTSMDPLLQLAAIGQLECRNIMLDTKLEWAQTAPAALLEAVRLASMVVMNYEEASTLMNEQGPEKQVTELSGLGPRISIVNLGPDGSIMYADGKIFRIKRSLNLNPVETTGAGDSLSGAFIANLSRGVPAEEAFLQASVISSFTIEDFGPKRLLTLTIREITERYQSAISAGLLAALIRK